MTFTDDDLKRLKHEVTDGDSSHTDPEELVALLARLEAAECNMGGHSPKCSDKECVCSKKDREEAWRKACGPG